MGDYGTICGAQTYDMTRCADAALTAQMADLLHLRADGTYLDLGCGTGNYSCALAALGGQWHGLDPSSAMLAQAAAKSTAIDWHAGRAEALPFAAAQFDGVSCILALHHMSDLATVFRQLARVMKADARLVFFTALPAQARACWLSDYFPRMIEEDACDLPALASLLHAAGAAGLAFDAVTPFHITPETQDRFFYSGKYHPALYLDAQIRANMSPFRRADRHELDAGLAALARDIESGLMDDKIAAAATPDGDYTLVAFTKTQAQ